MIQYILCNYIPYTQKERAKEILLKNANFEDFKLVFEFNGKKYYKKIR